MGDKNADGTDTGKAFSLKDTLNLKGQSADPDDPALPLTGTSSGDVVIADGGTYHVQLGEYTHSGNMTINGGTLQIGAAEESGDASLSVSGGAFAINSDSAGKLIIKGNKSGGKSTLDLSNATDINVTGSTFTSIDVGDANAGAGAVNASLKLNGDQLTKLFSTSGVGVLLNADGEIDVSSAGTLKLDGSQLQAKDTAEQGKLTFNNGGVLRTNELRLTNSTVNIGKGSIESNKLSLDNTNLGSGIFHVVNELVATQDTVELNDGTSLTLGRFTLDKTNADHPDTAVESGSLGGNPAAISSNLKLNSGSNLNIIQGDWKLKEGSGDLTADSGANITIGAVNGKGDAYQIYDAAGSGSVVGAALTGNKLTLNGDGTQLTINSSGKANFKELDSSTGSSSFDIKGTLDIANDVKLNSGDTVTITGDLGIVHFGDAAAHKITAKDDGLTLKVEDGSFTSVFDLVSGGHLKLDLEDQVFTLDQIKELRKTLLSDADNEGNAMDPTEHGFIHLGNAQIKGVGDGFNEIPFDKYNPTTGEITSSIGGIASTGDGTTILALSAEDQEALKDIADIRTNVGDDTLLYDVTRDKPVVGNIGFILMKEGVSGNAIIGDSVTLGHANAVAGSANGQRQFISGKDGSLRGADIQSGGALYLENGGHIGEIKLEAGSADDSTILTVNKRDPSKPYGSGADGITYINAIKGGAHTRFDNNDVTHVTSGGIAIDELNNTSDLFVDSGDLVVTGNTTLAAGSNTEVSGDIVFASGSNDAKTTLSGSNSTLKATNITFGNHTVLEGQTTATSKVSTSITDTAGSDFTLALGAKITAKEADLSATKLDLNGKMELAQGGQFSGNVIHLGSDSLVTANKSNLDFTATGNKGSFEQEANSILSGANLTIKADHDVILAGNSDFTGSGSVTAGGKLNLGGVQSFDSNAKFTGDSIDLAAGTKVSTKGDLSFTVTGTTGSFVQRADTSLNGVNLKVTANDVTLASNTFAGTGTITAKDKLNLNGDQSFGSRAIFTGNVINLASGSSISSSSGDLSFKASGSTGSFVLAANSNLSGANITFTGNKFDANGAIKASQDIHIGTSGATGNADEFNLAYSGNMTAGRDIYLDTVTNSINGTVAADQGTLYVRGKNNVFGDRAKVTAQKAVFQGTSKFAGNGKFSQSLNTKGDFTLSGMIITAAYDHTGILRIKNGYLGVQRANLNSNSTLSVQGEAQIGTLTAADASSTITVGGDSATNSSSRVVALSNDGNADTATGSSISSLQVDSLNLNGSKLAVSSDYANHAALLAITGNNSTSSAVAAALDANEDNAANAKMARAKVAVASDAPTADTTANDNQLNGTLFIGKNSAVAWGSDLKTLKEDIATYQDQQGALGENSDKYGSILVVNQPLKISSGSRIVLDHNADATADIDSDNSAHALAALSDDPAAQAQTGSGVTTADLSMTERSAIILKVDQLGEKQGAAIQFAKKDAKVSAESGSTLVLAGNYNACKDIEIFSGEDGSGVELAGSNIKVRSKSGLFVGELEVGEEVQRLTMTFDEDVSNDLPVSDEIRDLINSYNPDSNSGFSGDNSYLDSAIANEPEALDEAARFDAFGGVAQATQAVSDYMTDSMLARIGIGSMGTDFSNAVDNKGTAKMWVNPTYVRQNNKGFAASGLKYGNKLDLYGLNAGVEVTLNKQFKAGALLNFGTGNSKGKESADGVKNDFDYFGAGAYVSSQWDNFTLLADVSYNKVRNDLETVNGVDKLAASLDSEDFSLGVTGKLDFDANGVHVTPYAGLRYHRYTFDDYDLKGDTHGNFVHKENGSMDVWEVPVGVAVSKSFITNSGWQFKPAVDLHLKANLGDDKLNGKVAWNGTNAVSNVSSEVFDPLSYGVNASITAKKGNFNMGAGVGYTGSANTNEFAVQANFSYNF